MPRKKKVEDAPELGAKMDLAPTLSEKREEEPVRATPRKHYPGMAIKSKRAVIASTMLRRRANSTAKPKRKGKKK